MNQSIQNIDPSSEISFARSALFDYALHIAGMVLSLGTLSIVALIIVWAFIGPLVYQWSITDRDVLNMGMG